eukprot:gene9530-1736_t
MKFKLNLEILPLWATSLLFLAFFILLVPVLIVGYVAPSPYNLKSQKIDVKGADWKDFLAGKYELQVDQNDMKPIDLNIYFSLVFFTKNNLKDHFGFSEAVKVNITLFGKNPYEEYKQLSNSVVHVRNLACAQTAPSSVSACPVYVTQVSPVSYQNYRMKFTLNDPDLKLHKLLEPNLLVYVAFNSDTYTFYELIFRYGFLAASCFAFLVFLIFTRWKQPFGDWQTEQKWILFVLLLLICFNNPLYIFEYFSENWIFTFININLRATFICVLLFSILVFTHAMYVQPIERTFFKFYALKSIIVGTFWIVLVMCFTYLSITSQNDPSYSPVEENPYFQYVIYGALGLLLIYVYSLLYYFTRALGVIRKLPKKYSQKFKTFWGLSIFILIGMVVLLTAITILGYLRIATVFFLLTVFFNYYTFVLAFLFLPSSHTEVVEEFDLTGHMLEDEE